MKKKQKDKKEETIPGKIDQFITEKKEEIDALKKLLKTFEDEKEKND